MSLTTYYLYPDAPTIQYTIKYYATYANALARNASTIAVQADTFIINDSTVINITNSGVYTPITSWRIAYITGEASHPTAAYANSYDLADLALSQTTYYLYPNVVTIKYYDNYNDAFTKNSNPLAVQAGTWIIKDTNTVNILRNSGVFNGYTTWRIALVNTLAGAVPFAPPHGAPYYGRYTNPNDLSTFNPNVYYLYPDVPSIRYYSNLNAATTDPGSWLAEQYASYVINDRSLPNIIYYDINQNTFNSYTAWRIGSIDNDDSNDPIPSGVRNNNFDLTTFERGLNVTFNLYRNIVTGGSITIQYYSNYYDASLMNGSFIATQGTTWVINDQNVIDVVNPIYNTYSSWRIAVIDGGPAPPHGVYRNGFDLGLFNIGNYGFYLYPTITCFLEGTKILCLVDGVEEYLPIETLKPGVHVRTKCDGFKEIAMIGKGPIQNLAGNERVENRLYKCTPAKYPSLTEDLYITGCHSILEHKLTDKQRADSMHHTGDVFVTSQMYRLMAFMDDRAEPWDSEGSYTIWHVALENTNPSMNYGIYANGLLVESCAINFLKNRSSMTIV